MPSSFKAGAIKLPDNMSLTFRNGVIQGANAAVRFADGADNTLQNFSTVTTVSGVRGTAMIGASGNETINNYGTVTGSVDLGGGHNAFNNYGVFNSGVGRQSRSRQSASQRRHAGDWGPRDVSNHGIDR